MDNLEVVSDFDKINDIKNVVLDFWYHRKNNYFPAPQPVSLEKRDLFKFSKYEYLVCVKSDGIRFLLLFSKDKKAYMVNRKFKTYVVEITTNIPNVYQNSLFDGELIKNKNGEWIYIIHDCVGYCGKSMINVPDFMERYKCVHSLVENTVSNSIKLVNKKFVKFQKIKKLTDMIEQGSINHNTDGLIFTPSKMKIGVHTQYTLFKWKPRNLHTFDFRIEETPNEIFAQVLNKDKIENFASVPKDTEAGKEFCRKLGGMEFTNGSIVECGYNDVTECYEPIMIRADKSHPNSIYTVEKTLLNVEENITISDLIKISLNVNPYTP